MVERHTVVAEIVLANSRKVVPVTVAESDPVKYVHRLPIRADPDELHCTVKVRVRIAARVPARIEAEERRVIRPAARVTVGGVAVLTHLHDLLVSSLHCLKTLLGVFVTGVVVGVILLA